MQQEHSPQIRIESTQVPLENIAKFARSSSPVIETFDSTAVPTFVPPEFLFSSVAFGSWDIAKADIDVVNTPTAIIRMNALRLAQRAKSLPSFIRALFAFVP